LATLRGLRLARRDRQHRDGRVEGTIRSRLRLTAQMRSPADAPSPATPPRSVARRRAGARISLFKARRSGLGTVRVGSSGSIW
jgi:hypothetical protein